MKEKITYMNTVMIYKELFTKEECDIIVKYYEKNKNESTKSFNYLVNNETKSIEYSPNGLFNLNDNNEIKFYFKDINRAVKHFNKNFKFSINYNDHTSTRILKYEKGRKCDWHIDIAEYPRNDYKIDTVTMLSDKEDYTGGELKFFLGSEQEIILNKGDVIMFLPFMYHKVNEILSGNRYTIVSFLRGKNPLK